MYEIVIIISSVLISALETILSKEAFEAIVNLKLEYSILFILTFFIPILVVTIYSSQGLLKYFLSTFFISIFAGIGITTLFLFIFGKVDLATSSNSEILHTSMLLIKFGICPSLVIAIGLSSNPKKGMFKKLRWSKDT